MRSVVQEPKSAAPAPTTRQQLDEAIAAHKALLALGERIAAEITASQREREALADAIVTGNDEAKNRSRELRQRIIDAEDDAQAGTIVLQRAEERIAELRRKLADEAAIAQRAAEVAQVKPIIANVRQALTEHFSSLSATYKSAARIHDALKELQRSERQQAICDVDGWPELTQLHEKLIEELQREIGAWGPLGPVQTTVVRRDLIQAYSRQS